MKAVIQRVSSSSVEVDKKIVGSIKDGLMVLVGITNSDTEEDISYIANKILNLRLFEDGEKFFEKSLTELGKEILLISQFTLYSGTRKGRRPDFTKAAKSDVAKPIYERLAATLREGGAQVQTGKFGETMKVNLSNEGPITIILDSKETN